MEGVLTEITKAEIVINMYKQKLDIDLISSCVNIKKEEARKIIQDYLSLNKKD